MRGVNCSALKDYSISSRWRARRKCLGLQKKEDELDLDTEKE